MRIAFLVSSFPELSETFILRQVTGLLDRGHDVRIFARRPASDGAAHGGMMTDALRARVRVLPDRATLFPTAAALLRSGRAVHRDEARAVGGWRALGATLAALRAEGPFDVVHCHYGEIGLRYRFVARLWDAPLVVSFYGYDCSSFPRARGGDVYAPLFREADAVTSLSTHMDARLRELGCPAGSLRRVPLPVDPGAFTLAPRNRPRTAEVRLLTVARLTEKKGITYALRALAQLSEEFRQLRYDVIGDGPLRRELAAEVAALGLGERVRLLGSCGGEEVRAAMRAADLFVLPSVTAADGDEEGTPTVIVEAAFSGLPVVSTRHAGIPELVRDGESGVLVPECDVDALAAALRGLLRAPERWPAMGEAGRRHVLAAHATPAVAERLERLYEELRAAAMARSTPANGTARTGPPPASARSTPSQ